MGIGLRKGEWRGQGGGSHAGGDREFFLFAKVQLLTEIVTDNIY